MQAKTCLPVIRLTAQPHLLRRRVTSSIWHRKALLWASCRSVVAVQPTSPLGAALPCELTATAPAPVHVPTLLPDLALPS